MSGSEQLDRIVAKRPGGAAFDRQVGARDRRARGRNACSNPPARSSVRVPARRRADPRRSVVEDSRSWAQECRRLRARRARSARGRAASTAAGFAHAVRRRRPARCGRSREAACTKPTGNDSNRKVYFVPSLAWFTVTSGRASSRPTSAAGRPLTTSTSFVRSASISASVSDRYGRRSVSAPARSGCTASSCTGVVRLSTRRATGRRRRRASRRRRRCRRSSRTRARARRAARARGADLAVEGHLDRAVVERAPSADEHRRPRTASGRRGRGRVSTRRRRRSPACRPTMRVLLRTV